MVGLAGRSISFPTSNDRLMRTPKVNTSNRAQLKEYPILSFGK
jgi:hypothetical protein